MRRLILAASVAALVVPTAAMAGSAKASAVFAAGIASGAQARSTPQRSVVSDVGRSQTLKSYDQWLRITLLRIKNPAAPTNSYMTPDRGKKFVAVLLRVTNLSSRPYGDSPSNGAELNDTRHVTHDPTIMGIEPDFGGHTRILPHDYALGWITFEVPARTVPRLFAFTLDSGFADTTAVWKLR